MTPTPPERERAGLLPRVAEAIYVLFFADERGKARWDALRGSLVTDEELAALDTFSVGLFNFDPLDEHALAGLRAQPAEGAPR